ncbi:hypothetical protein [Euzebya pacifica]|uniref:hypothetical protein n=1 Tax=Euzebya pacifica TaxID=1608957 RepID=UPI0013E0E0E7|nr:hypothetical protein [Euzebya pacifica]
MAALAPDDHGCLAIADPLEVVIDCAAVLDAVGRTVDAARLRTIGRATIRRLAESITSPAHRTRYLVGLTAYQVLQQT